MCLVSREGRMAGGRPTDYSGEILTKTADYIVNYEQKGDAVPSVAGLSIELGIARSTIYEWAKDENKKEFSDMLGAILSTQERKLLGKGLKGEFNATIVKLMLAKHGYVEKTEQDLTHHGDVTFINDVPRPKE